MLSIPRYRKLRPGEFARFFWREVSRRMEPSPVLMVLEINPKLKREYKLENRSYIVSLLVPSTQEEQTREIGVTAETESEPEQGENQEAEVEKKGEEKPEGEEGESEKSDQAEREPYKPSDPRVNLLKRLAEEFNLVLLDEPMMMRGGEVDLLRIEISPDSFHNQFLNPWMRPLIFPMPAFKMWVEEFERLSNRLG